MRMHPVRQSRFITTVVALALLPLAAHAGWRIGKVVNGMSQPLTLSFPLPQGTTADARAAYGARGDAVLYIPGQGPLVFTDVAHASNCSRPYWAVKITYGTQHWKFFYDGDGILDVTISAAGVVTLATGAGSSASSQVVQGDHAIARCTQ